LLPENFGKNRFGQKIFDFQAAQLLTQKAAKPPDEFGDVKTSIIRRCNQTTYKIEIIIITSTILLLFKTVTRTMSINTEFRASLLDVRRTSKRPMIISLEGNIGAGKSTLLKRIEEVIALSLRKYNTSFQFIQEPVQEWEKVQGSAVDGSKQNMLELFYADPHKYSFPFQIMAYATQVRELYKAVAKKPDIVLTERSLESNHEIFTKMLYDDQQMEDVHYQIYQMNSKSHKQTMRTDAVIYLRSTPEVCAERIQSRGRPGEQQISQEYLRKCHEYHESWLSCETTRKCLVIDADKEITFYNVCEIIDFMTEVNMKTDSENITKETDVLLHEFDEEEKTHMDIYGW